MDRVTPPTRSHFSSDEPEGPEGLPTIKGFELATCSHQTEHGPASDAKREELAEIADPLSCVRFLFEDHGPFVEIGVALGTPDPSQIPEFGSALHNSCKEFPQLNSTSE